MSTIRRRLVQAFLLLTIAASVVRSEEPDAKKGEAVLMAMSQKLSAAKSFSFSTVEYHDRMNLKGEKVQINTTRDVVVRRPDGFWTKYTGDRDWEFWYDGRMLTGVTSSKKVYIQHETPPTLDQTMDMLAARLNLDLPVSDLLYSSPHDAFMDMQTTGGFTGSESINGASCYHLVYTGESADWQLWIDEKSSLPCRLEMTYKNEKDPPFYRITFSKWNLSPKINDGTFAAKIPEGYVRIPVLERVLVQGSETTQTQTTPSDNPRR